MMIMMMLLMATNANMQMTAVEGRIFACNSQSPLPPLPPRRMGLCSGEEEEEEEKEEKEEEEARSNRPPRRWMAICPLLRP